MDASRFKRRTIQTQRQPIKINSEALNDIVSPQVGLARPVAPQVPATTSVPVTVRSPQPTAPAVSPNPVAVESIIPVWRRTSPASVTSDIPQTQLQPQPQNIGADTNQAPVIAVTDSSQPQNSEGRKLPIDMSLPDTVVSKKGSRGFVNHGKWFAARKWAVRGVIASLVIAIAGGGLLFSQGAFKLHKVFHGGATTAAALKANVDPELLKGEGDGRVNVLLLGRGGGNHDGPDLTDTMILASFDPVNHTESLLSIPRDLWVNIHGSGSMKINAAWEAGEFKYLGKVAPGSTDPKAIQSGFDLVDQTVESVLGVPINYNIIVDFDAFQKAITTVGGVTVPVPTDLIDPTMAWENNKNPVLAKAGIQNFSGRQALNYVRSRETTSDFARSQRQRSVMLALKDKVINLGTLSNPLKISQLINDFGNNVSTDLTLPNAQRLYSITSGITNTATTSIGLADKPNNFVTTGTLGNQSIDLPTAGLNNYAAIQAFVHSQLKDGYILKENAKVMVYNGTTLPGTATNTATKLKSYGYNVIGAANTPNTGWTQTILVDLSGGTNKYTRNYLEQRYKVKAVSKMPDSRIATNGADFVIIIGSDEATTTQN
jgi:LCP family protein required for cell wall assembly